MIANILYTERQLKLIREELLKSSIINDSRVKVKVQSYTAGVYTDTVQFLLECTTGLYTERIYKHFELYSPCEAQYMYIRQALEREIESMERRSRI